MLVIIYFNDIQLEGKYLQQFDIGKAVTIANIFSTYT